MRARTALEEISATMEQLNSVLDSVNGILWHDTVLYVVLGVGIMFTVWSGF